MLTERIEIQPAVDAPMSDHIRRKLRSLFFNHEPLAFLTSHRALHMNPVHTAQVEANIDRLNEC